MKSTILIHLEGDEWFTQTWTINRSNRLTGAHVMGAGVFDERMQAVKIEVDPDSRTHVRLHGYKVFTSNRVSKTRTDRMCLINDLPKKWQRIVKDLTVTRRVSVPKKRSN